VEEQNLPEHEDERVEGCVQEEGEVPEGVEELVLEREVVSEGVTVQAAVHWLVQDPARAEEEC